MRSWIGVERALGQVLHQVLRGEPADLVLDGQTEEKLRRAKKLRNQIVFGSAPPSEEELERGEEFLQGFLSFLQQGAVEPSLQEQKA